ncbi:MAG: hypothetical protein KIT34_02315 [Cyanobacteria bacterium TGS_CYA1]|nr:hypothetical protein [Cyanobacteria bacterium TGS_CYA1]
MAEGEQNVEPAVLTGGHDSEEVSPARPFEFVNLLESNRSPLVSPELSSVFPDSKALLAGLAVSGKPGDGNIILAQAGPEGLRPFAPLSTPEMTRFQQGADKVRNGETLESVFKSDFSPLMLEVDKKTNDARSEFQKRFGDILKSSLPVLDAKDSLVQGIRRLEANQSKIPDTPENKAKLGELLNMVSSMIGKPGDDQITRDPTLGPITKAEIDRFAALANEMQLPGAAELISKFNNFAQTFNRHQPEMAEGVRLGRNYNDALTNQLQIYDGVTSLFEAQGHPQASRFRALTQGIAQAEQEFLQRFVSGFKFQKV